MPSNVKVVPSTDLVVERLKHIHLFTRVASPATLKWIMVLMDDEHGALGFCIATRID
jgi:hypothetical protein